MPKKVRHLKGKTFPLFFRIFFQFQHVFIKVRHASHQQTLFFALIHNFTSFLFWLVFPTTPPYQKHKTMKETLFHMRDTIRIILANKRFSAYFPEYLFLKIPIYPLILIFFPFSFNRCNYHIWKLTLDAPVPI